MAFDVMLVSLPSPHQAQKLCPVYDAFGVTIGGHVPGIAPLYGPQYTEAKQFPDPHNVSQETLLSWCLEVCAAQTLVDAFGVDSEICINLKPTELSDVLKLFRR